MKATPKKPAQVKPKDESVFIARVALALVRLPAETEALFAVPEARKLSAEVSTKFREALLKDLRVSEVDELDELDRDYDNARTISYFDVNSEADDLGDAVAPFEALRFNSPIQFRIRMLAKNQPKYKSMDDVPADDYLVLWNGIQLVIQWEQSAPRATGSGGHVVFDILSEIGASIGYPVVILACSQGCLHRFLHGDFVTFAAGEERDHFHPGGETPVGTTIVTPYIKDVGDVENAQRTLYFIGRLVESFSEAKTYYDALDYLEWRARRDSRELLALAYQKASRRTIRHPFGAIADTWALRGSRAKTKRLLAGLWLALASIDTYRVIWRVHDLQVQQSVVQKHLSHLESLFDTGRAEVESQDLSLVRTSLQEVASRMEGWLLIAATGAGAAAGIGGAALAALLRP